MKKSVQLIKKEYCLNNSIKDPSSVHFELHGRKSSGEYVFIVRRGEEILSYTHNRVDLSGLTDYEGITLPTTPNLRQQLTKTELINHLKNKIGYLLTEEDISFITLSDKKVTVGIARDSMRYSGDFSFKRG